MIGLLKKYNSLLDGGQKKYLVKLSLMMIIGSALEVMSVSLMLPLVTAMMKPDIIQQNEKVAQICQWFQITSHSTLILSCIVAFIIFFFIKDIFLIYQTFYRARFVFESRFRTQQQLLHSFLNRPYEYYLSASTAEILRNIHEDVFQAYTLFLELLTFFTESFTVLTIILTLFVINPMMSATISIVLILVVAFLSKKLKPALRKKGNEFRTYKRATYNWLLQAIESIKETKVAHKETFFERHFETSGKKQINAERQNTIYNSIPRMIIEMCCVCSALVVLGIAVLSGNKVVDLIPAFAAFAMAAIKLMPSANSIVTTINNIAFHAPALDHVINQLSQKQEQSEISQRNEKSLTFNHEISFENICFRYPNSDTVILDNAQITIPIGSSVGIVGVSGAGKTTAVDIMLGLLRPQSGKIMVDGQDVMSNYEEWLSHIGYIPQSTFMMNDSIKANVAFGNEPDDERVWQVLREAQLDKFVAKLPKGIETEIGERGIRLSGGQKQRISIARALYNNPELLFFDEATSSLDNETESAIMESINAMRGCKTMIIIAHRLQTIEGCDMIYRVKDEKIIREK